MSEATIELRQIQKLNERPRTSKLREQAMAFSVLTSAIEKSWEKLPPPMRDAARASIYHAMDQRNPWVMCFAAFSIAKAYVTDREALLSYVSSIIKARNALLNAIEREHAQYGLDVEKAFAEATDPGYVRKPMSAGEFSGWIRSV